MKFAADLKLGNAVGAVEKNSRVSDCNSCFDKVGNGNVGVMLFMLKGGGCALVI